MPIVDIMSATNEKNKTGRIIKKPHVRLKNITITKGVRIDMINIVRYTLNSVFIDIII